MTNLQIIAESAIAAGVYTEEQVKTFLERAGRLPLFTFAEWKKAGYSVKKGEHATLTCYIWKPKKNAKKAEPENEEEERGTDFFKVKAFFFTPEQVQKLERVTA